jgi:DNA-binding NarL/FixJ family response regulator
MMRRPNHALSPAYRSGPESRRQLERQARGRTVPMRVALHSHIVLLAAEGKQHKQISEELKISPRMAALYERDFCCRA